MLDMSFLMYFLIQNTKVNLDSLGRQLLIISLEIFTHQIKKDLNNHLAQHNLLDLLDLHTAILLMNSHFGDSSE